MRLWLKVEKNYLNENAKESFITENEVIDSETRYMSYCKNYFKGRTILCHYIDVQYVEVVKLY